MDCCLPALALRPVGLGVGYGTPDAYVPLAHKVVVILDQRIVRLPERERLYGVILILEGFQRGSDAVVALHLP